MKTIRVIVCMILVVYGTKAYGRQPDRERRELFGKTINAGIGLAYYNVVGGVVPVARVNYEIDVAENITIAPFVSYFAHHQFAYPDKNNPLYRHYYRESIMPVGVTGMYYFDDVLKANDKWDFYAGLSLGAQIMRKAWENGYNGASTIAQRSVGFYWDGHLGFEFHLSYRIGFVVDVSRGISTAGVAVHL